MAASRVQLSVKLQQGVMVWCKAYMLQFRADWAALPAEANHVQTTYQHLSKDSRGAGVATEP